MKTLLLSCVLIIMCHHPAFAGGVLISIRYERNAMQYDAAQLADTMSAYKFRIINYTVDNDRSIEVHSDSLLGIISILRMKEPELKIILLADRESSFVGLDVASKDTSIIGLITLSGVFNDGTDYLYDEASVRRNMAMLDSLSSDRSKERSLDVAYQLISDAKKGKRLKQLDFTDHNNRVLYDFLHTAYGNSIVSFSLERHLSSIRSWIIPLHNFNNGRQGMYIDQMNLSRLGDKYGIRYAAVDNYDNVNIESRLAYYVSGLLTDQMFNLFKE